MTEKEFKKYEGKTTFGFVRGVNIDGCIVIGYDSIRNGSLIVGCYDSRGWTCLLTTDVVDENLKRQFESFLYVNVENVKIEKDLDLTSILKGCEGVELWSDMFGKCKLSRIDPELTYQIKVETFKSNGKGYEQCFSKQGKWNVDYPEGKCMLWPSETNRDWSTFKKPVKVDDGDWVVCGYDMTGFEIRKYFDTKSADFEYIIQYDKFRPDLTEEDLKKLSIV